MSEINALKDFIRNFSSPYRILEDEKRFILNLSSSALSSSKDDKIKLRYHIFNATIGKSVYSYKDIEELSDRVKTEDIWRFAFLILAADSEKKGCQKTYVKLLHYIYNYFEEMKKQDMDDEYSEILKSLLDSNDTQIKIEAACILSKGLKYKTEAKKIIVEYLQGQSLDRKCLQSIFETYRDKMNRRGIVTTVKMVNSPISISEYDYLIMKSMKDYPQIAKNFKNDCLIKWKVIYHQHFHSSIKDKIHNHRDLSDTDKWILKTVEICLSIMSDTEILEIIQLYIINEEWNQSNDLYQNMTLTALQNIVEFLLKMIPNIEQSTKIEITNFQNEHFKNEAKTTYTKWRSEGKMEHTFFMGFILAICGFQENKTEIEQIIRENSNVDTIYGIETDKLKKFFPMQDFKLFETRITTLEVLVAKLEARIDSLENKK